jgi:hypothetical protein
MFNPNTLWLARVSSLETQAALMQKRKQFFYSKLEQVFGIFLSHLRKVLEKDINKRKTQRSQIITQTRDKRRQYSPLQLALLIFINAIFKPRV